MITFAELKNKSRNVYPAVVLEKFSSHRGRGLTRTALLWLLGVIFILMLITPSMGRYDIIPDLIGNWFRDHANSLRGLFFMVFSLWASAYMLEAFYRSYYFRQTKVDYDVAKLAFLSNGDITEGFLKSDIGQYAMLRLGISDEAVEKFIDSADVKDDEKHEYSRTKLKDSQMNLDVDLSQSFIGIKDYGHALYQNDKTFADFLSRYNITEELFLGALKWVDNDEWQVRNAERWWSRERLSRIQSVGRNWSFGKTYTIEKFGHRIMSDPVYSSLGDKWRIHMKDVESIERILIKTSGANVMLVPPTTEIGMEVVASLGKMLLTGKVLTELEDRRIFVIDTNLLITEAKNRSQLEENVVSILAQANKAGNIILVIPHMDTFIDGAAQIGVDIASLFAEVLSAPNIHIVGISGQKGFHESVETNNDLMQHFEKIKIEDADQGTGLRILLDESHFVERKTGVFFLYQSLHKIAKSAERFFVGATYSDKIIDLLEEVANKVNADKRKIVTIEDINDVVAIKTGVPQGKIEEDEREQLNSLEDILHRRVIGQNEAIETIADVMRRGRAGITNPKRPIGSFLFIGPTGVGKTETTKALAENFFKSEEDIMRLDMSEFNGADAVEKLIGSHHGDVGVLAEKILNKQYGVLLLDEFEKTTSKVMDLFLQILDEGQFTDGRGKKINARNLIIVATSNAGSDLIYKGQKTKQEIVDAIIDQKIFKPELLNRFDSVVLFHVLNEDHLRKIAKLMLQKLDKRLSDKGLKIDINDDLLNYLIKVGSNQKFGAREMNRAIQDEVEGLIAEKIVAGKLANNSSVTFEVNNSGKLEIVSKSSIG
jgi:ATP-dependent Clp protease ATP-binding subunit ClpA